MRIELVGLILHCVLKYSSSRDLDGAACRTWTGDGTVAQVIDGEQLDNHLKRGPLSSSPALLALNIINGTRWLNLGGKLDQFELVLGTPPATSSPLSLHGALKALANQNNANQGVILNFIPDAVREESWAVVNGSHKALPIWISYSKELVESGKDLFQDDHRNVGINIVWNKKFALDSSLTRVFDEAILLPADFYRVQKIIQDFYDPNKRVSDSDGRFLKSKFSRVASRNNAHSFTELFLESAVQLVVNNDNGLTAATTRLLPDLQDKGHSYSKEEISELEQVMKSRSLSSSSSRCVFLTLRTGVLAEQESLRAMRSFVQRNENVLVNAFSKPYDLIDPDTLATIREALGERVLFQLPLGSRLKIGSPSGTSSSISDIRVPDFDKLPASKASWSQPPGTWCFRLLSLIAVIVAATA